MYKKKKTQINNNADQFQEYEHVYKIIMIGSSFSGKTSLLFRFVNDSFDTSYLNTVGVDLKSVTLKIYDTMARINIWDTTGQEKFKSLTKSYFRNCQGAVAVFDLTKKESFYSIEQQIREFRMNCPQEAHNNVVLVGNKLDLVDKREIPYENALDLCKRLNLLQYFETSASSNLNVDELFYTVTMKAYQQDRDIKEQESMVSIGKDSNQDRGVRIGRTSTHIQLDQFNNVKKKGKSGNGGGCCSGGSK